MTNKKLILVIDDDPDILESIEIILTAEGFLVTTASSAEEGILLVDKIRPDLILCDMMMETVDAGTKVVQDIRKKHGDLPIYLMSNIGDATASNIEISELGFKGVFQKPVDPGYLVSSIKKCLGL